ncbi:flagellar basal-body MS-ring/collar protein FliF [Rhodovibrionaceae bacterium A322]
MNTLFDTFRSLGPSRLAVMGGVATAILAFFVYFASRVSQPEMQLLYADLASGDSAQIMAQLDSQGVPYEISPEGSRIMVPADKVAQLRITMAEQGIPSGGSLGYEIFDQEEGLGSSSFQQNMNHLRALEGELARSIRTLQGVKQARVHLVLPQRELFTRHRNEPTASIILTLRGNRAPNKSQISAIQQLVAAAVPEMKTDRVAIVDDKGNLLARTRSPDDETEITNKAEEARLQLENRLATEVEQLLERSVGIGNVRVELSAELDFDRVTENSETYDPDGQVVRSTQTVEESNLDSAGGSDPVTVGGNLPDANLGGLGGGGASNQSSRTEETVNYEISRTQRTHVRESGNVRRLSVAVLVNGSWAENEEGELVYSPRSEEEMQQLANLARSAIGYDEGRGDSFEIANMQFSEVSRKFGTAADTTLFGIDQQELIRVAELLVLGIVAILILLLVVKPLVTRLLEAKPQLTDPDSLVENAKGNPLLASAVTGLTDAGNAVLSGAGVVGGGINGGMVPAGAPGVPQAPGLLAGGGGAGTAIATQTGVGGVLPSNEADAANELEQMIDVSKVEGRVRASSLRKLSEMVEQHPEETVAIVRGWLYQDK